MSETKYKICNGCGKKIKYSARFCNQCGMKCSFEPEKKVVETQSSEENMKQPFMTGPDFKLNKVIKTAVIAAAVLLISGVIIWYNRAPLYHYAVKVYWQNEWRFVEGKSENEKMIKKMLGNMTSALEKKDVAAACSFICPNNVEAYKKMFEASPDGMTAFAQALKKAKQIKITAESPSENGKGSRMAEVTVSYNGDEFQILLQKIDDNWYLNTI